MDNMKKYAPVIVRWGMALVYLWFGYSQVTDPVGWTVWLPPEASLLPFAPETLIFANGVFEIIAGTLLLIGVLVRPAALLLALHLAGITFSVGLNDIGVRDFGLILATLSVFAHGPDLLSLAARRKRDLSEIIQES